MMFTPGVFGVGVGVGRLEASSVVRRLDRCLSQVKALRLQLLIFLHKTIQGEFPGVPVVMMALSLPRAWVLSLDRELGSHKPHGMAKKKKKTTLGLNLCCHCVTLSKPLLSEPMTLPVKCK